MAKDKEIKKEKQQRSYTQIGSSSGAIYGLGVLGVAWYYLQHAASFWIGVIGVIKAIFWPALLLYRVFSILHL